MKISHHNRIVELDDAWWIEAGMQNFSPKRKSYRANEEKAERKETSEVRIDEISSVKRIEIFKNNENKTARTRVTDLLRGFIDNDAIEPVEVVSESSNSEFRYKLTHGVHRLYCSLAAGFTHIPSKPGFDWETLDK